MSNRTYHAPSGSFLTAEEIAAKEAILNDDSIKFAGRGKNRNLVHVLVGEAKKSRSPHAVCGLWVSNSGRPIREDERVCTKCVKGGASFSTYNQPRDCSDCGRKFADSKNRDNNDALCPECYEVQGIINEHSDGYHDGTPNQKCPDCQVEDVQEVRSIEGTGSVQPSNDDQDVPSCDVQGLLQGGNEEAPSGASRTGSGQDQEVARAQPGQGDHLSTEASPDANLRADGGTVSGDDAGAGRTVRDLPSGDESGMRGSRSHLLPGGEVLRAVREGTPVSTVQSRPGSVSGQRDSSGASAELPSDASVGAALTALIAAQLHKDWLLGTGKPNNVGGQTIQFKMPDGRMVIISVGVFS